MSNKSKTPLISVIVPVYNVQEYLPKCLESILHQTYTNLEIILVDDGSTDSSGELCDYYGTIDNRIQIIHQSNRGLSSARNVGFSVSHGEYVLFVDSDDFIHSQLVSLMLQALLQNNAELACCLKTHVTPDFTLPTATVQPSDYSTTIYENYKAFYEIYTKNYTTMIVCWNKLYKRNLISSFCFPQGRIHEDEFFSPRVLSVTKTMVMLEYPLYFYVTRPDSITNSPLSSKSLDKLTSLSENATYFKETNAYDKYILEGIRLLDYCISFCVTFRTQNGKHTTLERTARKIFIDFYKTFDRKSLSMAKRTKYTLFYRLFPLFMWQEIYLRKKLKRKTS